MGGERGNIGQSKIGRKGEEEREELMEPEETITALKIREGTVGIGGEKRRGESMELSWSLEEREEEGRKLGIWGGPPRGFAGARPGEGW